jgi:hypothetical protein
MTERELLLEQITINRQLIWLAVLLFVLMFIKEAVVISRIIRRYLGLRAHDNGDPLDDVTYGQFTRAMKDAKLEAEARTASVIAELKQSSDLRFNAIDKQLEIARRKDNVMLIILRDIRAWMIYGQKPKRDLPPLEEEGEFL